MIYLDNAATSWPKPPEVVQAMADFLERAGGNPGRSGHRLSIEAGRIVYATREAVAALFHARDPLRIVFTLNATQAINTALRGLLRPGELAVTTGMEHNALMRPLRALEREGVRVRVIPCGRDGSLDLGEAARLIEPGTRLVAATHASNVTGGLLPVAELAEAARRAGALFLLDAAQTAGLVPIDLPALGVDLLAFTGHKGLQGPPGTGGLILGERVDPAGLPPLLRGGTGSHSEFEEQPAELPDRYESGTPNGPGLAGLGAGVRFVLRRGLEAIRAHERLVAERLTAGLSAIAGVSVQGPADPARRTGVVSFTVAGRRVSEIGLRLDEECGILCRVGLHCAPAAHRSLGTFPEGTVRLSPGLFTGLEDVPAVVEGVRRVVGS